MHTAELLVPESSYFEIDIDVKMLKIYRLLGTDQISAELIKVGAETLHSEVHELIFSVWDDSYM
jgi:hypothetical protein